MWWQQALVDPMLLAPECRAVGGQVPCLASLGPGLGVWVGGAPPCHRVSASATQLGPLAFLSGEVEGHGALVCIAPDGEPAVLLIYAGFVCLVSCV